VQSLANGLQQNQVILIVFSLPYKLFQQTLTDINLGSNDIGPEGAKYLANALQLNKVITIYLSCLHHSHAFLTGTQIIISQIQSNSG
jgi:tRNA G37 N-methylase Trm5